MAKIFSLVATLFAVLFVSCSGQRLVGTINNINYPALLNVYEHRSGSGTTRYSILTSSYDTGRATYDNAYVLYHPGLAMSSGFQGYGPRIIFNQLYWPKKISQVPSRVFNFDAVAIPDGSVLTGKTTGSIYVTNVNDFSFPATHNILQPRLPITTNYQYSSVVWLQADAGVNEDILACRVLIESGVVKEAQLVMVEQPTINAMDSPWSINVIKESACDTNIVLTSFNLGGINGRYDVIYTTGLHLRRLVLFYTTNNFGYWRDSADIQGLIIDQGRQFFDLEIVDINNDGKLDLLTTVIDRADGSVEVWEIPNDFRQVNNYVRHVIASGFAARTGGSEGRAPGAVKAFYPTGSTSQKPYIAVAGADDGRAYVLRPLSQTSSNWDYELVTVADYGLVQTVSGITAADVDGDGYTELFVSVRNLNYVQVFSYSVANDD